MIKVGGEPGVWNDGLISTVVEPGKDKPLTGSSEIGSSFERGGESHLTPVQGASLVPIPIGSNNAEQALGAADSYGPSLRSMKVPQVLDALIAHPDPKLGVLAGGLRDETGAFRSYAVVGEGGGLVERQASYDGEHIYLYVPESEQAAIAALNQAIEAQPEKYGAIQVRPIARGTLADREERLALKYDRPGTFWVSSSCPLLPGYDDPAYIVPGGRFGIELYYHDTRINLPGARSTVESLIGSGAPADRTQAEQVLSAMRGTVNALANEVLAYGKIFNATLTVNAGRSQPPCLTQNALHTYEAWIQLHPEQEADARRWLGWVAGAARQEYETVWMSPPRHDDKTGLSRFVDETPSVAPEEDPKFYAGLKWSADDIASDAAIREHGWDSTPAALVSFGPDKGKPRIHHLLPVCLNSLLYRYEKDLAAIGKKLGGELEKDAGAFEAAAEKRKQSMDRLMWNEAAGLYMDLVQDPNSGRVRQNGHEDLRCYAPLVEGLLAPGSKKAKRMHARIADFMRPGGLATATEQSWQKQHDLNPGYTDRCQWGHKDVGWPISTYETAQALLDAGFPDTAHQIAYRWCHMVQSVMAENGGAHPSKAGGTEAPIMEKMDVTKKSAGGAAEIGYGNQGAGDANGEGAGFRWGYDAYKLLFRMLPDELQAHLRRGTDPDLVLQPPRR